MPISIRLSTFPYGSGWGLGVQAGIHPHTKEEVAPGYQPCPCAIGLVQREDTYRRAGGDPGLWWLSSSTPRFCRHCASPLRIPPICALSAERAGLSNLFRWMAGAGLTLEVLAFHFRSPVNYRSFGFGGYAFSHIGGPEVIPALLDNSQSTRSLWSKAHLLKHSLASAHHHCALRLYVAPREKGLSFTRR